MGKILLQILMSGLGTFGFCLIFNINKKHILIPSIGGALCWAIFSFLRHIDFHVFPATLLASSVIGVYGVIASHKLKFPTTIVFMPSCVPLIPGGNLYYALLGLISGDNGSFIRNFRLLVVYAVGIAAGLSIVGEFEFIRAKLMRKIQK